MVMGRRKGEYLNDHISITDRGEERVAGGSKVRRVLTKVTDLPNADV